MVADRLRLQPTAISVVCTHRVQTHSTKMLLISHADFALVFHYAFNVQYNPVPGSSQIGPGSELFLKNLRRRALKHVGAKFFKKSSEDGPISDD